MERQSARAILERLVAFPTMSSSPNLDIAKWIRAYLAALGVESSLEFDESGGKAVRCALQPAAAPKREHPELQRNIEVLAAALGVHCSAYEDRAEPLDIHRCVQSFTLIAIGRNLRQPIFNAPETKLRCRLRLQSNRVPRITPAT